MELIGVVYPVIYPEPHIKISCHQCWQETGYISPTACGKDVQEANGLLLWHVATVHPDISVTLHVEIDQNRLYKV